jgi:hypothetical protein
MPDPKDKKEKKGVAWYIPAPLRHGLNSHAEYLSIESEISTDAMVTKWLEERLKVEERVRALRTLEIEEKDLPRRSIKSGGQKA